MRITASNNIGESLPSEVFEFETASHGYFYYFASNNKLQSPNEYRNFDYSFGKKWDFYFSLQWFLIWRLFIIVVKNQKKLFVLELPVPTDVQVHVNNDSSVTIFFTAVRNSINRSLYVEVSFHIEQSTILPMDFRFQIFQNGFYNLHNPSFICINEFLLHLNRTDFNITNFNTNRCVIKR